VTLTGGRSRTSGPTLVGTTSSTGLHTAFAAQFAHMVDSAIEVLMVDYVGLMLLDEHDDLRPAGSSDEPGSGLETVQVQLGVGPGLDTMQQSRSVAVTDLSICPQYAVLWAGLPDGGARAVLSCPVRARGGLVGSFEAARVIAHVWTAMEIRRAESYARVIGLTLDLAAEAPAVAPDRASG